MSYQDLGALLRKEREKRGLTIDDVARRLKIMPRQLTALEEGDIEALPHMAYAKGFIRSYATFLGISKEDAQKAFEGDEPPEEGKKGKPSKTPEAKKDPEPAKADAKPVAAEEKATPEIPQKPLDEKPVPTPAPKPVVRRDEIPFPGEPKRKGGGKGLVFFILLCLLAGGGYWAWNEGYFDKWLKKTTESNVSTNLPRADEYMAEKDAAQGPKQSAAPEYKPETAPAPIFETSSENPVKELLDQKAPAEPAPAEPEATPTPSVPPSPAPAVASDEPREPHNLIITAVEECWVHSNADKTDTRQFSLRKGDTFALSFSDSLELKLGNAGGVRLRYDGAELPPPGTSGQVKTIVFPPKDES